MTRLFRSFALAHLVLSASLLLASCGGSDGPQAEPAPSEPPPGPAPELTIQSSTPARDATGVDRGVQPQLTLSAAADPATVTLSNAAGAVTAAVTALGTQVTVAPALRLLPATSYTVRVGEGPTLSFTTRDGAWSAAPPRVNAGNLDAEEPHVAMDAAGNAIAVWYQLDGATRNIWASRYERATGWSVPATIDQSAELADSPEVAMDAAGNAIAVWIQRHVGAPSLWASRFTPAGGWETPELLELLDGSAAILPHIAMNATGYAVVTWFQSEATGNIYVNRYVPGAGWQGRESVETHPMAAVVPRVAVAPSGQAVVMWRQQDAVGTWDLYATSAAAGGAWSAPVAVEQASGDIAVFDLAAGADGAVAAWTQWDSGRNQCWAAFLQADGNWAPRQRLDSEPGFCYDVQVATDALGGAQFVWSQDTPTGRSIWTNASTRAGGWGTAARLTTGGEARDPAIGVDAVGNALAVWRQDRGDGVYPAFASRRLAGAAWSTPIRLEPGTDGYVTGLPVIAMDASGSAVAFWPQYDAARSVVDAVASHFD